MGSGCNEIQINFVRFQNRQFPRNKRPMLKEKNDNKTKQKVTTTKERQNP